MLSFDGLFMFDDSFSSLLQFLFPVLPDGLQMIEYKCLIVSLDKTEKWKFSDMIIVSNVFGVNQVRQEI